MPRGPAGVLSRDLPWQGHVAGAPHVAPEVAACYDCHGYRDIVPPSDPSSTLAPGQIVQTCRKCHPEAPPKFAGYLAHANHIDREHYPMLYDGFSCS